MDARVGQPGEANYTRCIDITRVPRVPEGRGGASAFDLEPSHLGKARSRVCVTVSLLLVPNASGVASVSLCVCPIDRVLLAGAPIMLCVAIAVAGDRTGSGR